MREMEVPLSITRGSVAVAVAIAVSISHSLAVVERERERERGNSHENFHTCTTLQHTATPCHSLPHPLQHTATHYNTMVLVHHVIPVFCHINTLQHPATPCNTLQHPATPCNTLQQVVIPWYWYIMWYLYSVTSTPCNTLQHTATPCSTLQHTATHCNTMVLVHHVIRW